MQIDCIRTPVLLDTLPRPPSANIVRRQSETQDRPQSASHGFSVGVATRGHRRRRNITANRWLAQVIAKYHDRGVSRNLHRLDTDYTDAVP